MKDLHLKAPHILKIIQAVSCEMDFFLVSLLFQRKQLTLCYMVSLLLLSKQLTVSLKQFTHTFDWKETTTICSATLLSDRYSILY